MDNAVWNTNVSALLYRIQKQDRQALQTLYQLASAKMLAMITRIVSDQFEAEDVLQEIFIKIWQQANQHDGNGSAWGWLCVMTRNSSLDRLRKIQTHPHISTDEDTDLLNTLVTDIDEPNDIALSRCLQALKVQTRKCVLMSYLHGYSHSELAATMSVPLGTAKAWIRRGLQELKVCLEA